MYLAAFLRMRTTYIHCTDMRMKRMAHQAFLLFMEQLNRGQFLSRFCERKRSHTLSLFSRSEKKRRKIIYSSGIAFFSTRSLGGEATPPPLPSRSCCRGGKNADRGEAATSSQTPSVRRTNADGRRFNLRAVRFSSPLSSLLSPPRFCPHRAGCSLALCLLLKTRTWFVACDAYSVAEIDSEARARSN